jgi:ribonucleoside-diphosphate reductase alpha chain
MSTETTTATAEDLHPQTSSTTSQRQEPLRRRLPDERKAIVHHFSVGGHEGYLMVGLYEDGQPGEIFIRMAKEGSTIAGLMDSFGIAVSMALQYGVSLSTLVGKFSHTRFEPSGWSGNPKIGYAKSLMDYLFRYMALKFLPPDPSNSSSESEIRILEAAPAPGGLSSNTGANGDGPACKICGAIMTHAASSYRCKNCGWTCEES